MTNLSHHLRILGLALAAVVGLLSMAGEASARPCCVAESSTTCRCCSTKANPPSPKIEVRPGIVNSQARPSSTASPCECRSQEPSAPAPKSESRAPERRADRIHEGLLEPSRFISSIATTPSALPPAGGPSGPPRLFLTNRLLI